MRTVPAAVIGSLFLLVGIVSPAVAGDTAPTPTPTVSVTPEPEPTEEPTEEPDEEPELPEIGSGTFTRTPASGPVGTTISLTSKTPCVDAEGEVGSQVEVVMLGESDLTDENDLTPTVDKIIEADAQGGWKTTVKVPASAKPGEVYALTAGCFAEGVTIDEEALPFIIYDVQIFTVTTAVKAPVATPVVETPTFTG